MSVTVRGATPDDLPLILSYLDEEFVFGKARRISLAQRFPTVYCPGNTDNIFLLEENNEILSCLACKPLRLRCDNNQWQGMMIGAVYTRPNRRGEHLGSHLLEKVTCELRNRKMDFAVLWTDKHSFYARLGWSPSDPGVLATLAGQPSDLKFRGEIIDLPLPTSAAARVEAIREQWHNCLTLRTVDDYGKLPLPAETAQLLLLEAGSTQKTYALLGNCGDTGIIYEMIGHPSGYSALWAEICHRHKNILVNDSAGSPSFQWLAKNTSVVYEKKPLAMWQLFSKGLNAANTAQWYIPHFDRI